MSALAVISLATVVGSYAWRQAAAPLVQSIVLQSHADASARAQETVARIAADSLLAARLAEVQDLQRAMLRVLMGPGRNSLREDLRKLRKSQESMLRILLKPPSRQEREKLLGELQEPYRRRP